jgi:hypothetical protein
MAVYFWPRLRRICILLSIISSLFDFSIVMHPQQRHCKWLNNPLLFVQTPCILTTVGVVIATVVIVALLEQHSLSPEREEPIVQLLMLVSW